MTVIIWTVHLVVVRFFYVYIILMTQWSQEPVCTVTDLLLIRLCIFMQICTIIIFFFYVNTVKFLEQVFGTLHFFNRYLNIYERLINYYWYVSKSELQIFLFSTILAKRETINLKLFLSHRLTVLQSTCNT